MGRTINIGAEGFAEIRKHNDFYVDKSKLIKTWWEARDQVTLITRPRRFGKTLNMDMINCFFSIQYANRSDLFEGLQIWEEEKYRAMQGTWPVILLSFADIKSTTCESALTHIKENIAGLYDHHHELLSGELLTENEIAQFKSVTINMPDAVAETAIRKLAEYMSRYYQKKVIVILDEYDTPMQEAWISGYWDEMVSFLRGFFNATFKTNPYLERGLMTGITRISKESIFSDLNNLKVVTTTSKKYADCFGFTEDEVMAALEEMGLADTMPDVKIMYDGFTFGTHTAIYNPWSIVNYLDEKELLPYWANTSSNGLIDKIIREGDPDIKQSMEDLLNGQILRSRINEQIVFNQLDGSPEAVWSLLLASGYLKVVTPPKLGGTLNPEEFMYELALTNLEVRLMFEGFIGQWFGKVRRKYNAFTEAMIAGDVMDMNMFMNDIALQTFSMFDAGSHPSEFAEPEKFYHGFVLGMMVDLRSRFAITSNRESGYGRYDIMMEPLNKEDPAIIIEFKVFNPGKDKDLEDTVAVALQQIEDKQYAAQLEAKGIEPERIRKYGFAFQGKKVLIG